jgi:hypothetical protein
MIFEALWDSVKKGELILIDGGYCRFHLRKDGQLTILEIISLRKGAGSEMLEMLKKFKDKGATSILAKCPEDLVANGWYLHKGFKLEGEERTKSGRGVILWRLNLI